MRGGKSKRRVLFAVGFRDSGVTNHRLLRLVKTLSSRQYDIDVVTCDEELVEQCAEVFDKLPNVRYAHLRQNERFWTMVERDSFAQTFIKLNHDVVIPGIDLKFWKLTGFDDFLWNTSSSVFPDISERYDAVIMPIPSFSEGPSTKCDVFYTHVVFHAKQNGIPIIGLQIYPIFDVPPVYARVIDHFVVKEVMEKDYFTEIGIAPERITIIGDVRDNYCLSTVQDEYRNLSLDDDIHVPRESIGIVVVNHSRNRAQLYDVLETIGELDLQKSVFFVFLNFSVKELHEKNIYNDLIQPVLKRTVKSFYTVETGALVKSLMLCDAIISTNYIVPLSFAGRYGKQGIVYNPLLTEVAHVKGVQFANSKQILKDALLEQYERKRNTVALEDVVGMVAPCH